MNLVQDTSRKAYYHRGIQLEPTQFKTILDVMKPQKLYTRRELYHLTGIETSTISARVNSLIKQEKIKKVGRKKCPYTNIQVEALVKVEQEPVTISLF